MEKVHTITDAPKPRKLNKKFTTLGAVALGIAAAGLIVNDKLNKQSSEEPAEFDTEA